MTNLTILLQASSGGGMMNLVFFVAIIIVFYFFMLRPQMKKQKIERDFRTTVKKGDKIVTIGGLHGRVLEVNDRTFMIEIDTNVKVKIEKSAISVEATKALEQPVAKTT